MTGEEPEKRRRRATGSDHDLVEVITVRRIGLEDRTSGVGERVAIPRWAARKLQEAGAVKVVL